MAKGYSFYNEEDETYVPSRPTRKRDSMSRRPGYDYASTSNRVVESSRSTYTGGHYAESPIVAPPVERTLEIVPGADDRREQRIRRASSEGYGLDKMSSRRSSTLPGGGRRPTGTSSRHTSRAGGPTTMSKVTRSRSLSSRPAGISVYHPPSYARAQGTSEIVYPITHKPSSRPASRMTAKSGRSQATGLTSTPGKNTTKAGVVIETMSAPNPFCPNTRGVCCLLVLVNLALILVAIGFIIVLQLHDPAFVWNIGIVILVFGFVTFFVALVYCMCICQEAQNPRPGQPRQGELYWTHHWQKNITIPEIQTRNKQKFEEQDRFPEDDLSDTSSRDYPRLYLESDYGQRTDREADFETEQEGGHAPKSSGRYSGSANANNEDGKGRY